MSECSLIKCLRTEELLVFMSINPHEEVTTGVTHMTGITPITLKFINHTILVNETWLGLTYGKLLGDLATSEDRLNSCLELHTKILQL